MTTPAHGPGPDGPAHPADPSDGPAEPAAAAESSGPSETVSPSGPATPPDSVTQPDPVTPPGLSERERAVLAVERQPWAGPGAKERAVREQLGISPTRYYQLLNALLDDVRALAEDPVTVNRLRRLRDARRSRR